MKTIPLTRGLVAVVDDEDHEFLSQWKWHAIAGDRTFYAGRRERNADGKSVLVLMHRVINGTPDDLLTDHEDCDGLNNVRSNLRDATPLQNVRNRRAQLGGTSVLKGVWHDPSPRNRKHWRSAIRVDGRLRYLGRFATEREAHAAYSRAAEEHFGQFARTSGDS